MNKLIIGCLRFWEGTHNPDTEGVEARTTYWLHHLRSHSGLNLISPHWTWSFENEGDIRAHPPHFMICFYSFQTPRCVSFGRKKKDVRAGSLVFTSR